MGDFSIRCAISGVPIPCMTPVLIFKMGKNERHAKCRYPVDLPVAGVMGSYGETDDYAYEKGYEYLHVLPELWKAAGEIWYHAMLGKKTPLLVTEIQALREEFQDSVVKYKQFKGTEAYDALVEMRCEWKGEWLRRLKHTVLFAPDFGKGNAVVDRVKAMVASNKPLQADQICQLREFICGFMASCIYGKDLLGSDADHPFEQYPDLEVDLAWHQAIVKEIKRIRQEAKKEQDD
jgi:hypothetical protein